MQSALQFVRFYPGIATARDDRLALGSGWTAEAILPPAQQATPTSGTTGTSNTNERSDAAGAPERGRAKVVNSPTAAARAPRVIGSFDHAVLPMPPVSPWFLSSTSSFVGAALDDVFDAYYSSVRGER